MQVVALMIIAFLGLLMGAMSWTAYEIGKSEGYEQGLDDAIRIINEEYRDIYCQGCNPKKEYHLEPVKSDVKRKKKHNNNYTAEFYKRYSNKVVERGAR